MQVSILLSGIFLFLNPQTSKLNIDDKDRATSAVPCGKNEWCLEVKGSRFPELGLTFKKQPGGQVIIERQTMARQITVNGLSKIDLKKWGFTKAEELVLVAWNEENFRKIESKEYVDWFSEQCVTESLVIQKQGDNLSIGEKKETDKKISFWMLAAFFGLIGVSLTSKLSYNSENTLGTETTTIGGVFTIVCMVICDIFVTTPGKIAALLAILSIVLAVLLGFKGKKLCNTRRKMLVCLRLYISLNTIAIVLVAPVITSIIVFFAMFISLLLRVFIKSL